MYKINFLVQLCLDMANFNVLSNSFEERKDILFLPFLNKYHFDGCVR